MDARRDAMIASHPFVSQSDVVSQIQTQPILSARNEISKSTNVYLILQLGSMNAVVTNKFHLKIRNTTSKFTLSALSLVPRLTLTVLGRVHEFIRTTY